MIEINADDDQLEDRIDEALEYWRLYHYDGVERFYLKQRVNASRITINENNGDQFRTNTKVVGETSRAEAFVIFESDGTKSDGNTLIVRNVKGDFLLGENLITAYGVTATYNNIQLGELDKKYLDLPDWVYGIARVLPIAQTQTSKSMFDIQYQLRLNDIYDLTSTSVVYYSQMMSHLSLLDNILNGKPMFRYNRTSNRLYLDISWTSDVRPGDFVIVDCYRALDPSEFTKIWDEAWLKKYCTALFKRQWGQNLSKFSGLSLPGGVTLDGVSILSAANDEIAKLEEDLLTKSSPLEFFLG